MINDSASMQFCIKVNLHKGSTVHILNGCNCEKVSKFFPHILYNLHKKWTQSKRELCFSKEKNARVIFNYREGGCKLFFINCVLSNNNKCMMLSSSFIILIFLTEYVFPLLIFVFVTSASYTIFHFFEIRQTFCVVF